MHFPKILHRKMLHRKISLAKILLTTGFLLFSASLFLLIFCNQNSGQKLNSEVFHLRPANKIAIQQTSKGASPVPPYRTLSKNYSQPKEEISFLNDRACSVIGAAALQAEGFVRPEGLTGAGQIIAIADSGLGNGQMDNPHPDLKSEPGRMPKVIMLKSWAGRPTAEDPNGHGTHMAGTIAGTGAASGGKFAGIAPQASIYFQAILNQEGSPSPPGDLSSLFAPAYAAAARIHVDGWGGKGNTYSPGSAQVDNFIREHPDFLVIFGAGNDGPLEGSLTNEANSKNALVIGAGEGARPAFGPEQDNVNEIAGFSSRGPAAGGRIKPDLVAPGTGIISAVSPLIKSNFTANPQYTRMQGTSQAAAVTGGAVALLREYLQKEEKLNSPSAALLKAALINGATTIPGEGAGFGRLDLSSVILALKEKLFSYVDAQNPLQQDEKRSYSFEISNQAQPFVATLAWTDPTAPAGASKILVNNLDLIVTAPDGQKYLGNDDSRHGKADDKNNVERVIIPYPKTGTYTVEVKAAGLTGSIRKNTSPAQDFALVFGQKLQREVTSENTGGLLKFTSGNQMTIPTTGKNVLGRTLSAWGPENIFPGEDAYLSKGQNLYLTGEIWRSRSVQNLPLASGTLTLEADPAKREGGFYLSPRATVLVNGHKTNTVNSLPAGIPAMGLINPSAQTIWWLKTDYTKKEGVLEQIDTEKHQLFLYNQQQPYTLDDEVAFSFADTTTDGSRSDLPYGAPVPGTIDQLTPGMPVQLIVSSANNRIVYIAVSRQLAVGVIRTIDGINERITLEEGGSYQVITGAPVTIDCKTASLGDLKAGLHAALLLAGNTVISVQANLVVTYGQVIYFNAADNTLYFLDYRNRMQTFTIKPDAKLFRWWQQHETSSLLPGEWTRLTLDPQSGEVERFDVAEAGAEQSGVFDGYDPARGLVNFSPSKEGLVCASTCATKNGYPVQIEDFLPGEKVEFTLLDVPKRDDKVIAAIKGHTPEGVKAPLLQASCEQRGGNIIISGVSGGENIYIYTTGGQATRIKTGANGQFSISLPRPEEKTLQIVTVEKQTGGVAGTYVTIPEQPSFSDIKTHPAKKEIEALAAQDLLKGYSDSTFRPDQKVTRAEFTTMLTRVLNLDEEAKAYAPAFTDQLPAWAANAILLAAGTGIIDGYPDGTFRAGYPVSGLETICILARITEKITWPNGKKTSEIAEPPPTPDEHGVVEGNGDTLLSSPAWSNLPPWAIACSYKLNGKGLLPEYLTGRLFPYTDLTRAEAAAIMYQLWLKNEKTDP